MEIEDKAEDTPAAVSEQVFAALPDALLVLSADLVIVRSNDQFRRLFNLPIYAARQGASVLHVADQIEFDATGRHPLRARWQRMFSETEPMDHLETLADGRSVWVRYRPMPEGQALVLFADVTAEARRNADQSALARQHEQVSGELSELTLSLMRALDSSLRKITDSAARLETKHREALTEGGRVYLERMSTAASTMRDVMRDLKDYADQNIADALADVPLEEVIRAVLETLRSEIAATGANVEYGSLPTVPGDRHLLQQFLEHVIRNALMYRREGVKPFVKIECRRQTGKSGRPEIVISITDNGAGFDPQHSDAVFRIFQSMGPDTDTARRGFGLAACRKIARLHAGAVTAASVPGQGTTITLVLPAEHGPERSSENVDDAALLKFGGANE